jgi:septum formation protein
MEGEPAAVAEENARRKALAIRDADALVLGADTLVAVEGAILGKPADAEQARDYVGRLAGRAHLVVGGIALARGGALVAEAVEITEVRFRALSQAEVAAYVRTGEWQGRAGGYAIQGRGAALVEAVDGDFWTVVGLPLAELLRLAPDLARSAG